MCCASVTMVPIPARTPSVRKSCEAAFNPSTGWNVAAIEPDRVQTRYHDDGAGLALLATISRI